MPARLAMEETTITLGGAPLALVPSLRAATRLFHRFGGFGPAYEGVLEGNVTVMDALIREGCKTVTVSDLTVSIEVERRGLGAVLDAITEPLAGFVFALIGLDPAEPEPATRPTGKPMPIADYHRHLFEIATGALGWPPDAAWRATPAEILAAYKGRGDLLKAIFGSADDPETTTNDMPSNLNPDGTDPEFDRAGFEKLRAMSRGFG